MNVNRKREAIADYCLSLPENCDDYKCPLYPATRGHKCHVLGVASDEDVLRNYNILFPDEPQEKTQIRKPTALEVAVEIHAAKVVKKAVQGFMDGVEFEESISEDYKAGFYEFGHAVIKVLEDMEGEDHVE